MIHFAAIAATSPVTHPFAYFGTLMQNPVHVGMRNYLVGMPEDLRAALRDVLKGGWYACSKGHSYYVAHVRPAD